MSQPHYIDWNKYYRKLTTDIHAMLQALLYVGPAYYGEASSRPWSGYWWPMLDGPSANLYDPGGPLEKYDAYANTIAQAQSNAVSWEKNNHYTNDPAGSWWGHCNGWAAAATLEAEPTVATTKGGIVFGVGDQKGLLSELHWFDLTDLYQYFGAGGPHKAHVFHKILLDWVGKGKTAVIMDTSLGGQVWNFPVTKYQMQYEQDPADPNKNHVTCTIWFASDGVLPDYVGTEDYPSPLGRKYYYWISGDINNPSDGDWESTSTNDHPDQVWHPMYQASGFHGALNSGDTWVRQILS